MTVKAGRNKSLWSQFPRNFWTSKALRSLSEDAKLVLIMLLTSPSTVQCVGILRQSSMTSIDYLAWQPSEYARIQKCMSELIEADFIQVDEEAWVVFVPMAIAVPMNPKQLIGFSNGLMEIPDSPLKAQWVRKLGEKLQRDKPEYIESFVKLFGKGFETVVEPFRNRKENKKESTENEKESNPQLPPPFHNPNRLPSPTEDSELQELKTRFEKAMIKKEYSRSLIRWDDKTIEKLLGLKKQFGQKNTLAGIDFLVFNYDALKRYIPRLTSDAPSIDILRGFENAVFPDVLRGRTKPKGPHQPQLVGEFNAESAAKMPGVGWGHEGELI